MEQKTIVTSLRERKVKRIAALNSERDKMIPRWKELNEHIMPSRSRFFADEVNSGNSRNTKMANNTPALAANTFASGMSAGVTSPARPWFKLATPDPELGNLHSVKEWLSEVESRMREQFNRSNLYNILPTAYKDFGVYATAAIIHLEDPADGMRFMSVPVGSYAIGLGPDLRVNTFCREYKMTVGQLVEEFGFDNCSISTQTAYNNRSIDQFVNVQWIVEKNTDRKLEFKDAKNMPFSSIWMEASQNKDEDKFLRQSGFEEFAIYAPRSMPIGEDTYGGDCPGMLALGDCKALQLLAKRKAQALDKKINPPLSVPSSMRTERVSALPGDITYDPSPDGRGGIRSLYEVNVGLNEIIQDIQETEYRINKAFFVDLFLMLANSDRRQITAREVEERHEEKLLMLGPVLERIHDELLDPLIDRSFSMMLRNGQFPEPPEELQGFDLKVEYISVLAQAQKLVNINGIDRFARFIDERAASNPAALDKADIDKMVDAYADSLGVDPTIVRGSDAVMELRAARAEAQQQQQQAEQMMQAAQGAKTMSETDMESDSALTRAMGLQ